MKADLRDGAHAIADAIDVDLPAKEGNDATAVRRHISDFAQFMSHVDNPPL
jgi:hypothetical protein